MDKELEADRFAAAAMKNAGMSLDDALTMAVIFDERPSRSHPAKVDRIQAIKEGWENRDRAKSCNQ
ncbi:M48 family metalloprotease [Mesorhizobium sp. 1B3]|uniref:M48 family metalloprotease n=1 Tax=Mesorhizobium sp. 1B3 TaxID=3243599 RepID=UPI003D972105